VLTKQSPQKAKLKVLVPTPSFACMKEESFLAVQKERHLHLNINKLAMVIT
jgi:hypothetical protein